LKIAKIIRYIKKYFIYLFILCFLLQMNFNFTLQKGKKKKKKKKKKTLVHDLLQIYGSLYKIFHKFRWFQCIPHHHQEHELQLRNVEQLHYFHCLMLVLSFLLYHFHPNQYFATNFITASKPSNFLTISFLSMACSLFRASIFLIFLQCCGVIVFP